MSLSDRAAAALSALDEAGLRRSPPTLHGPQGPRVTIDGRSLLGFCSNNYLGLADSPAYVAALAEAARTDGLGAGASRLVSGTMTGHRQAEAALASFLGLPDCAFFSTGYAANLGALSGLYGPGDLLLSDALNHASLIDGCRLSRAKVDVVPHLDLAALEERLAAQRGHFRAAAVVTDSVFSMDGDEADLHALRALCDRYEAELVVDEAHALGLLGPGGRGLAAELSTPPDVLTAGLGKSFGLAGGLVAAQAPVVDLVRHRARSYVFSTAPLPASARLVPLGCASVAAADEPRARVLRHAARLRAELTALGYRVKPGRVPIVPVVVGAAEDAVALSRALFARGVFVQAIRPPTVPRETSRLRLVPLATHTEADLDQVIEAFAAARAEVPAALEVDR